MSQIDLSSYKSLYIKTAREYLEKLDANLASLKKNSGDLVVITQTHLNIHSLGSQSYAMGYNSTGALCQIIESYFHFLKESNTPFDLKYLADVETSIRKVRESVTNIDRLDHELDLSLNETNLFEKLPGES
jgi:chemotaxis protein histidine kinase CheA